MRLAEALDAERVRVEALQKSAGELQSALRAWHKACFEGALPARERAARRATELAAALAESVAAAAGEWSFDVGAYLSSGAWREEIREAAAAAGLRVSVEQEHLVSSPVAVHAQVAQLNLKLGKRSWSRLHPEAVIRELARLRGGSQRREVVELLNALCGMWRSQGRPQVLKFRDAYEQFSLAPGWKRENPEIAFVQRIHALSLAYEQDGLTTTSRGVAYQFERPSADPRRRDKMLLAADDGTQHEYYGIVFQDERP